MLFLLAIEYGQRSPQWQWFHDYYGMLYSVAWIVAYPLIIIGSEVLWHKLKEAKMDKTKIHSKTLVN
jgi:hypothetical protein